MIYSRTLRRCLAGSAFLVLVTGCNPDDGRGPATNATGGNAASANDFGGSGVVLSSSIASPFVLFQNDSVSRLVNRDGGAVKQNGVNNIYSLGAYVDPNDGNRVKLFVNDRGNHRTLIFNNVPQDATALPDVVVGQADFVSATADAGGATSAAGLNDNVHVSVCSNGKMFVADRGNNRVLVYNRVPTANGTAADFVIGQPNFSGNTAATTASGLNRPYAAYCMDEKLFIVDKDNNRIMVYDPIPTATNPTASYVIGQPNMGVGTSGCTASSLNSPYEILRVGDTFFVSDGGNHRVLRFDSIPVTTGSSAAAVLGQANLSSCLANRGGGAIPTDKTLNFPNALAAKGNLLAVSDHTNNRTMLFDLPIMTDQSASRQIGQSGFVTSINVTPPTANSVTTTKGLIFDQLHLWIGDGGNRRLAVIPLP
ncbi:MAG: hypothetical protein Q8L74_11650 [Nitrospirota bacterium]|nr:hypothetical protein [Nitrospirota bacterium]MDP2383874.1 hypothetical protein [Nitrospirota bacterium]MDP3596654.1 hypothetical protein [Nitrospirota bacterium]